MKNRHNKSDPLDKSYQAEWQGRCAWCGEAIPEDQEVFALKMRFRPGVMGPEKAGSIQPLHLILAARTVPLIVVGNDSPAKKEGVDGVFQVCGDACGAEMRAAVAQEVELGSILNDR